MERAVQTLIEHPEGAQARVEDDEDDFSLSIDWTLETNREEAWKNMKVNATKFQNWLTEGKGRRYLKMLGLVLRQSAPISVFRDENEFPTIEVHSVRPAYRRGSKGSEVKELVIEVVQHRRGYFDPEKQKDIDKGKIMLEKHDHGDFQFRRGCTILINPQTLEIRRVIRTEGTIEDDDQLERVRQFITREDPMPNDAFYGSPHQLNINREVFAGLHRNI